ncbi:MAG: peptidase MA family metallohydrolase [Chloroflexota bacterium]
MKALIPRVLALLVALVVLAGQPAVVSAAERLQQERRSGPLVVRYVGADDAGGQAEFSWYASAVEQAYQDVQDVFAVALRETQTPPRSEIVVTLYGDDDAYRQANPLAGREDGVLGHAQPSEGIIGVAVARLRDKTDGFRRDAIRHELTHVILGDLSKQRLPIGFQEGVAQYLERDLDQRQRFANTVRRGRDAGRLLSLADLNRQRPFLGTAGLAYPQSYSMVVFLAEKYGFGKVIALVLATREAQTLEAAVQSVFGRSLTELDADWQAFLPGYLDQGWARDDLDLWGLDEPRHLLVDGKYAEARDLYDRADALFASVGRPDRQQAAQLERGRAVAGVEATDLTQRGMTALADNQYDSAVDLLGRAESRWRDAQNDRCAELAAAGMSEARDGQMAVAKLAEARQLLDGWHFHQADDRAYEAGQVLAELGDAARTEEARQIMRDAQQLRTRIGIGAAGGGVAGVGLLGTVWVISRRRRSSPTPATPGVAVMERDWSL